MSIEEQYKELLKFRKLQSNDVLKEKQKNAWEYFRSITNVANLEKNINVDTSLYYAPLKQIHGSSMTSWPVRNGSEIYVDENFAIENKEFVNIQLQHEILHILNCINGRRSYFGYLYDGIRKSNYIGINEAITQMFSEDITGVRLDQEIDYLYFIKNIMRIMKALFGAKSIVDQYFNNNFDFTNIFNSKTNYKFEPFVILMNDVYILSKKRKYTSISEEQDEELRKKQQSLLTFTASLIQQFYQRNKGIINVVCYEVQDPTFLEKLGLQVSDISNSIHLIR